MVLFLDSGIGGLPYCKYFLSRNPGRAVLYFADREGFPYGAKSKNELVSLLCSRLSVLLGRFGVELAVFACNTASVSALDELRGHFPAIPFVGTVPAVKPAVEESRSGVVGVIGTMRTIDDPYIDELSSRYGNGCRLVKRAAPELVDFVEKKLHTADADERRSAVFPYIETFLEEGADGIVLGCTHFLFLLDAFREAAGSGVRVYDSLAGVIGRAESLLPERHSGSGNIFLISGGKEPEQFWIEKAAEYGMTLRLLDGER